MVVALASPQLASAQGFDAGGGTLGTLLNQLQSLEDTGALGDFVGGRATSRVDQAREKQQQELDSLQIQQIEDADRQRGRRNGLTTSEFLLAEKYCREDLTTQEQRALALVRNFSYLEQDYCRRTSSLLQQYGYDTIFEGAKVDSLSVGAISQDYVLGISDELVLTFHGQENRSLTVEVDREGRIVAPGWAPIPAAGRTFGEVRREIEVRTATTRLGTEVFVSLGAIRAVSVNVIGEVNRPGRHQLTALSTMLDAVAKAGGVKKTGSLRRIHLRRGDRTFWVDTYELLFSGIDTNDLTLFDGDQIVVPPLGATLAVYGDVRRPAIYELAEGQRSVTVAEALQLSGGTIRPRGNRHIQITFDESGREQVIEHGNLAGRLVDGDILHVARRQDYQAGSVYMAGHVRVPGRRSLSTVSTVSELIGGASSFKPDPYLLFAVLETVDPRTQARRLFPLNLQRILNGDEDYSLRDADRLFVLGGDDVRYLTSVDVQEIVTKRIEKRPTDQLVRSEEREEPQGQSEADALQTIRSLLGESHAAEQQQGSRESGAGDDRVADLQRFSLQTRLRECAGLQHLVSVVADKSVQRYTSAIVTLDGGGKLGELNQQDCPQLFDDVPEVLSITLEHVVAVNGAVREPGLYPVAGDVPMTSIIAVSGGLTRDVDLTRVEVSRYTPDPVKGVSDTSRGLVDLAALGADKVAVASGDVVRFNAVFTDRDSGPVLLAGEFVRPGLYEIRRGERLSEVINRAGGMTPQAYPYGAVFTRETVREAQQEGLRRAERELNSALAVAAVQRGVDPRAVLGLQQLAQQLGTVEALGRVVIEADPTVLQVRPELDPVLEPGDRLYMPKRPNFVSVVGDVLSPGAMQFIPGTSADRYIRQAGGFQRSADEDRVFVVYPNGAAEPLAVSVWNYNPVQIPPGSTVVVPKDPAPLDLVTMVREGATLIGQLAVTAASLAVISRD